MPTTWYNATVTRITEIAPEVRSFRLHTPESMKMEFEAGQFITLDLPIGDKRLDRWRSYSIANAPEPGGNTEIELCIVRSENGGGGTRYLFDEVTEGSTLRFKGPEGAFVLPKVIDKDLVFICTGTGIAPFRSMIRELLASGRPHRKLHLIFGTRFENGILYRKEFEELAEKVPDFYFDIALSREPEWPGYQGYVHQVYLDQYRDTREDVTFYICGWSNMIDEAVANLLTRLHYERAQIRFELYG